MSKIEWTEKSWNPVTGCSKISQGCKFCYAEVMAKRLQSMGVAQYKDGFAIKTNPNKLDLPRSVKKPTMWFVNSMSDLFHEAISDEYIQRVFQVMRECPQHIFQILTKRSTRMLAMDEAGLLEWSDNMWMGVSIEDDMNIYRLNHLLGTKAPFKWVSFEPLIWGISNRHDYKFAHLDWVVVGGESGKAGTRTLEMEWVDDIRMTCNAYKVPFFFKQWGKKQNNPNPNDPTLKKGHPQYAKGGCELEGKVYREFPELKHPALVG